MVLILDAAAPYADVLPKDRPDLTYFVGHPCHPPLTTTRRTWPPGATTTAASRGRPSSAR